MYFIDKLALRAGNEKDSDESADTVGCCSLRVEHISESCLTGSQYLLNQFYRASRRVGWRQRRRRIRFPRKGLDPLLQQGSRELYGVAFERDEWLNVFIGWSSSVQELETIPEEQRRQRRLIRSIKRKLNKQSWFFVVSIIVLVWFLDEYFE